MDEAPPAGLTGPTAASIRNGKGFTFAGTVISPGDTGSSTGSAIVTGDSSDIAPEKYYRVALYNGRMRPFDNRLEDRGNKRPSNLEWASVSSLVSIYGAPCGLPRSQTSTSVWEPGKMFVELPGSFYYALAVSRNHS